MRIRVKDVLEMLAAGATEEQILIDYPAGVVTGSVSCGTRRASHGVSRRRTAGRRRRRDMAVREYRRLVHRDERRRLRHSPDHRNERARGCLASNRQQYEPSIVSVDQSTVAKCGPGAPYRAGARRSNPAAEVLKLSGRCGIPRARGLRLLWVQQEAPGASPVDRSGDDGGPDSWDQLTFGRSCRDETSGL